MTILTNGHQWKYSEFTENKNYSFDKNQILNSLSEKEIDDAYSSISKWEGYASTPLILLNKLAKELNVNKIFYKDENKRFNLKSFKALGGAYAVEKITKGNKDIVVATATADKKDNSPQRRDPTAGRSNSEINKFPLCESHVLPCRPRPAFCSKA